MSGAESSAASWAARWRERVERMAQLAPARALRRLVVGEDVEGELRVVDAARATGGVRVRAPVLLFVFGAGLTGGHLTPYGWKGFLGGALIGWALGARTYDGAVPYGLPDPSEVRFAAEDLEVGNWLRVRSGGLVRRAARVTRLEDAGTTVRATLSNGQAKEWPWRRRVSGLVLLELPWPVSCGPRTRCLYAQADEELPAAWGLPRCGGPAAWSLGVQRLCDDHAAWAARANPGLRPVRDAAADAADEATVTGPGASR